MSARGAALLALLLLAAGLAVATATTTPWRPLGDQRMSVPAPSADFPAAAIAREDAFHRALRPPGLLSLGLGLAVALGLGLTPLGARVARAVGLGPWPLRVLLAVAVLSLLGRLVTLPLSVWREAVLRRYGLSTQSWASWAADSAKSWAVGLVLAALLLVLVVGLARRLPATWWAPGAALAALAVVAVSFAYPVVVEPLFNRFTPMPQGELRTSLLDLADRDGVPVRDVLVADASRRTTAVNAYVSGFGATRRIVVYDTLLTGADPDEVRLVVAHELGHAKRRDVLAGTLLGALGAATAVVAAYLLVTAGPLPRWAGVRGPADPAAVALLVAVATVLGTLGGPAQLLVSRRIETRADVHALDLTRDPDAFVAMQRRLAVRNLSDLDPPPVLFALFASHPTGPQRIGLARAWADRARVAEPPPLGGAAVAPTP